jgi:hypothetical protein
MVRMQVGRGVLYENKEAQKEKVMSILGSPHKIDRNQGIVGISPSSHSVFSNERSSELESEVI